MRRRQRKDCAPFMLDPSRAGETTKILHARPWIAVYSYGCIVRVGADTQIADLLVEKSAHPLRPARLATSATHGRSVSHTFRARISSLSLRKLRRSPFLAGVLAHMDLPAMLVELPLQGFHRRCRVPGQPRSGNRKVCVAAGALAMQPRLVVLGDLKMWLFHASSLTAVRIWVPKCQTFVRMAFGM
jgi:hypothetical protein